MKKIIHSLFLTCLRATELIEKKLLIKLSFKEKLQLKVHKMMCEPCTDYQKQSDIIDKALSNNEPKLQDNIGLETFKKNIIKSLKN